ncbi:hypothetical protein MUN78_00170 [Leucobacter allii]|uniref:Lipoprotein n=1 Tax=Leucobacter allii TaxID=2932247 RepID=A0ABY4FLY2_9MICO|nr:hypothetical protein [Leucobacter allii]UOQ57297.1 hypothetical protein MUN78_00170 [Leucobacter allii]
MAARLLPILLGTLLAAAALAGCAPEPGSTGDPSPTTGSSATTPAPPSATTPAPAPSPTAGPSAAPDPWTEFSDARGPVSSEIPPGWSVAEVAASEDGMLQLAVRDDAGATRLIFANRVSGLGGACTPALPVLRIVEHDATPLEIPGFAPAASDQLGRPLEAPRVVYRVAELPDGALGTLAVSNDRPQDSCMFYNLLQGAAGSLVFADALQIDSVAPGRVFPDAAAAEAFTGTAEYATLKRILGSLRLEA